MKTKEAFLKIHHKDLPDALRWMKYFEMVYFSYADSLTPSELLGNQIKALIQAELLAEERIRQDDEGYRKEIHSIVTAKVMRLQCYWIVEHLSLEMLAYIQGKQLFINSMVMSGAFIDVQENDPEEVFEPIEPIEGDEPTRRPGRPIDKMGASLKKETLMHAISEKKIGMFMETAELLTYITGLERKIFYGDKALLSQFSDLELMVNKGFSEKSSLKRMNDEKKTFNMVPETPKPKEPKL